MLRAGEGSTTRVGVGRHPRAPPRAQLAAAEAEAIAKATAAEAEAASSVSVTDVPPAPDSHGVA